mmetsp:Transcript_55663/g.161300  ORF Transcript_55663/g.161300 Transcript_55663/m.161300 type:complete len:290 (+) Transcript_55663:80-949(+)
MSSDASFEGWDTASATYMTDYIIMVAGVLVGGLMWHQFGHSGDFSEPLPQTFAAFGLLAGVGFGFMGIAVHVLATFGADGSQLSKVWFTEGSTWMFAWLLAMALLPLASASLLSTSATYSKLSGAWVRAAKVLGAIISVIEVFLCFSNIDSTALASTIWGVVVAVASLILVIALGRDSPGFPLVATGYAVHLVGYIVCFTLSAACARHFEQEEVQTESGPLYVKHPVSRNFYFCADNVNRYAIFHVCYAVSILILYCGVRVKADRDRDASYLNLMRNAYQKQNPRCCGV